MTLILLHACYGDSVRKLFDPLEYFGDFSTEIYNSFHKSGNTNLREWEVEKLTIRNIKIPIHR